MGSYVSHQRNSLWETTNVHRPGKNVRDDIFVRNACSKAVLALLSKNVWRNAEELAARLGVNSKVLTDIVRKKADLRSKKTFNIVLFLAYLETIAGGTHLSMYRVMPQYLQMVEFVKKLEEEFDSQFVGPPFVYHTGIDEVLK